MDFPNGETVIIRHPGEPTGAVDDLGEPIPVEPVEEYVSGVAVAPRFSEENNRGQATVAVGLSLFMPEGTVVHPSAEIEVRGEVFQVVGEPFDWLNPFTGWRPGVQVDLERAE